eukprot:c18920_g1_i1.p1 GENE.c18920_g1_i1~~c18920_g1_i1.p1  ORF type:complete len:115 (+),score=19.44 c18920_g1_i1:164-508(+)
MCFFLVVFPATATKLLTWFEPLFNKLASKYQFKTHSPLTHKQPLFASRLDPSQTPPRSSPDVVSISQMSSPSTDSDNISHNAIRLAINGPTSVHSSSQLTRPLNSMFGGQRSEV